MNVLDRFIEFVAPVAGVKRASARITLDSVRSYDGAMGGRRTDGWRATNASANVEIKGALPRLRARSRDLTRNTWWGNRIKSVVVAHSVGAGIMPKPKPATRNSTSGLKPLGKNGKNSAIARGNCTLTVCLRWQPGALSNPARCWRG
jgi:capsid protein